MKGSELIAEYLVQQKVPYVFGICGHGNVGMLDALYGVRDKVQLVSPRHEQCAGPHGRRVLPRAPQPRRDAHVHRARVRRTW